MMQTENTVIREGISLKNFRMTKTVSLIFRFFVLQVFCCRALHIYHNAKYFQWRLMMMNNDFTCDVSVNLPYPPTQPESQNPEYALAMLSNIGSSNSEMTAVSLYFYNSVILEPSYTGFAKCFHEISIVEMHHLDMFAELAYKMGADPRLWTVQNRRKSYWTPAYNQYPRNVRDVIINSIKGEEAAIQKYNRQANTIQNSNIASILRRIVMDEERHIEIFNNMLQHISK